MMYPQRKARLAFLIIIAALLCIITFLVPPFPQPVSYHNFADKRGLFGIPNVYDVFSNIPLFIIGIYGIIFLLRYHLNQTSREEKILWVFFFAATVLSAIFSIYYHLEPNDLRLALDRIGLSLLFISFFLLMLIECLGKKIGLLLAPFLFLLGIGSVLYWIGSQDLRFYGLVQYGSLILLLPLFLFFPSTLPGKGFLFFALGLYTLGKICELWDEPIYQMLEKTLSGHTLKHLLSSGGALSLIAYLRCRK
jgi:hypothetical protein